MNFPSLNISSQLNLVQKSFFPILRTTIKAVVNKYLLLSSLTIAASASSASGIQLNFSNSDGDLTNSDPNNIGATMTFNEIATDDGTDLDLLIEVVDSYEPRNSSNNGTSGTNQNIGRINIKANTAARFKFSFVETDTNNPYTLNNLDFSILDLDGNNNDAREKVTLYSNADYTLVEGTTFLSANNLGSRLEFTSTNDRVDNPSNTANPNTGDDLTLEQEQHAVLFTFNEVSEFQLGFEAIGGNSGRNFLFAGEMVFDQPTVTESFAIPESSPSWGLLLFGGGLLGIKYLRRKK